MLANAMHCLYCDSDDHPWFNCRKRPEGWKPSAPQKTKAKDAPSRLPDVQAVEDERHKSASIGQREVQRPPEAHLSGSRHSPTKLGRPRSDNPSEGKSKRAAEMRDYMRGYRARKRAKP